VNYTHTAYIGVGSNLGDKADNCRKGIAAVNRCEGCMVETQSPLYETEPVDLECQDWFVNGVARIRTDLEPETLLVRLKAIEHAMGPRPGEVRFGPRTLDLDILFYEAAPKAVRPQAALQHRTGTCASRLWADYAIPSI
jgi:2-amino-4-hydroxy-6-hydroxymethyldihydropteridine diphosphokinase